MIKAKLVVVGGDAKRTGVHIRQLPATIGRARNATITLPHALVSRQHCEIFEEHNQLFVKDLNSLNGTYLNSEKINGSVSLLPGQLLTLGNVTFRAVYEISGADHPQPVAEDSVDQEYAVTEDLQQDDTIDVNFHMLQKASPGQDGTNVGGGGAEHDTDHAPSKKAKRPAKKFKTESDIVVDDSAGTDGHRFVFDDEVASGNEPVSVGAIEDLPQPSPQASFAGNIDLESGSDATPADPNGVKLDLGDDNNRSAQEASQSSLGSFLRKLPK